MIYGWRSASQLEGYTTSVILKQDLPVGEWMDVNIYVSDYGTSGMQSILFDILEKTNFFNLNKQKIALLVLPVQCLKENVNGSRLIAGGAF